MDEKHIREWYAESMKYAATLADYVRAVGQNNRVLQTRPLLVNTATLPTIVAGKNPNRIGILVSGSSAGGVTALSSIDFFADDQTTLIFRKLFQIAIVEIAAVEVSREVDFAPMNILQWGPILQQPFKITDASGTLTVSVAEVIFNPKCCEYIGGMK